MAKPSLTTVTPHSDEVTHPDYIYSESSPFERAWDRLDGLAALAVVAGVAGEAENLTHSGVWGPLWSFVQTAAEDTKRDLVEFYRNKGERS